MRSSSARSKWWLSAAAIALGLTPAQVAASDSEPDAARLSRLVLQDCGSCHGLTLKGGLGKPLTPEHLRAWNREQLIQIILEGVPGTPMPPWRPLLTKTEAGWIADALRNGALR
jgi:cytochrome c55X